MLKVIALLFLSLNLWAADDHATISLQRFQKKLVLTVNHDAGWHTYWKNPGDSGLPSSFKFKQGTNAITLKDYEWPVPTKHVEEGDILTIGYEGVQHFFFDNVEGNISADITVLICKDICIPGEAHLTLASGANFVANRNPSSMYSEEELSKAFAELPKDDFLPKGFEYYLTRQKGSNVLTLHYSLKGIKNSTLPHELNFLTAFPAPPFGFKRESLYQNGDTLYGKTEIEWDGEYQEPPQPLKENGEFAKAYDLKFLLNSPSLGKVGKITLNIKNYSNATPALDDFYKKMSPMGKSAAVGSLAANDKSQKTLLEYLLFAFLGGLILNLMPCVLPVISLKLFGLIKHKNTNRKTLLKHNFSYAAGVITTFMVLASVIVGLKAGGEEIGWGFQLQSPIFIAGMMLVLFIMALNLFGLFEFSTPGGSKFGGMQLQAGFIGDFLSGVLTTILSTPCSAPFLGTALTFAFTTTTSTIFIMFFAIGLGLAFPFLLTAFFPQTLVIFPRPGAWMEKLKYFLGLSLVVTIVWLYDVFTNLVNIESMGWRMNSLFALWFFAFFFANKISSKRGWQFLFFALPLSLTLMFSQKIDLRKDDQVLTATEASWGVWSEEGLIANKGKAVFVDFTAAWCLTCKVNKRLVIETEAFEDLRAKYKLVTLRADWTRRDDNITQYLKKFGIVGVPAYFIQKTDGSIVSLGETISISKIEDHLK
jgi:thiol:disulfide interchange protein